MARYEFLWRRRDVERPHNEGGWRSKTIRAKDDNEAAEKIERHLGIVRGPVEIDYEVARLDVPYDPKKHEEHFWNLARAGIPREYY